MTEFWENHLNVPVNGDAQFTYRASYGDHIREHALGKFSDLLVGAITHPAMLIYLDQATSTKRHPNENLGRELLECHTVGRGNFTEDHVKASARILTGYTVDMWETWQALYNPEEHWRGTVKVMGFRDTNKKKDGRDLTRSYLEYLAHHPATARRIALEARREVRPRRAVGGAGRAGWRRSTCKNDTEIAPVLRALVALARVPALGGAEGPRPRRGHRGDVPRCSGIRMDKPRADDAGVNALLWQAGSIGIYPLAWPRPDGQPIDNASWSSPGRLMASMSVHYTLSGGWWPTKGAHYAQAGRLAARASACGSTTWSTTSPAQLLHRPRQRPPAEGLLRGDRAQAQREDRRGARPRRVGHAPPAHHLPRLPRIHEQVTPDDEPARLLSRVRRR